MKVLFEKYWLEAALIVLLALIITSAFIPWVRGIWIYGTEWNGEATRSIVLSLGAVGAFYGLILAARRLGIQEQNQYSERFDKAIELMASQEIGSRFLGLNLLTALKLDPRFCKPVATHRSYILSTLVQHLRSQTDMSFHFEREREWEKKDLEFTRAKHERGLERFETDSADMVIKKGEKVKYPQAILATTGHFNSFDHPYEHCGDDIDCSNLALPEAYFQNDTNLNNVNFEDADLEATKFFACSLVRTNFRISELSEAVFANCHLTHANFESANLNKCGFIGSRMKHVLFRDANLSGVSFRGADMSAMRVEFCRGITENSFKEGVYELNLRPRYLCDEKGIEYFVDESRAYTWELNPETGQQCRRFVSSSNEWSREWIDKAKPKWKTTEDAWPTPSA